MTQYQNEPFVVGDYHHNEIEFMHLSHELWFNIRPFPYWTRLFGYSAVSRTTKVFLFGGCCDDNWAMVTRFENDEWFRSGSLNQGRFNHLTITYGTDVMIIGGKSEDNQP